MVAVGAALDSGLGVVKIVAAGLAWLSLSLLTLGVGYLGWPRVAFRKDPVRGRVAVSSKVVMLPYLLFSGLVWHLLRAFSPEEPWCEVAPGIVVGRRLLGGEYPARIATIVDLTAEMDERRPAGYAGGYFNVPILDAASLPPDDLQQLAARIAALPRPIYLHCAQGHGRTAMVTAAVLLASGEAKSPQEALDRITARRPLAQPNARQRRSVLALGEETGKRLEE